MSAISGTKLSALGRRPTELASRVGPTHQPSEIVHISGRKRDECARKQRNIHVAGINLLNRRSRAKRIIHSFENVVS
ncbi:hypothetical protein MGG_16087 [Pyricularia oryzae 70-15]|uniref:Uncharacterized protein n=1 Tax=Pyricularia oryzae (strain 70-15 / ATCC MYA-4617 / FGSC 8958) TaxID=242507 RepID=G4MQ61_PYRO7|nr:uncharacterized protein MGG_16087 [Pyricularia oryzae 70-15]EHA56454.1 hypothetical protein MGG_16087 [Pyricularia oryzae 70-15]